ncbi:MAG: flagellar hook protein FlgE [Burkholderiales bacterium]
MGFQTGLSGLSTSSRNLDVIGNNVANASVAGFKGSVAQFSDVYASAVGGSKTQIGIGSKMQSVAQMFNQGNITPTSNSLDFAIAGRGFFRMSDNGEIVYSRNGQFRMDREGFLVNSDGLKVTGYGIDSSGNIVNASPTPLQFDTADIAPKATTTFEIGVNLNSDVAKEKMPTVTTFDPDNVNSFNFTTSGTVYDTLGNSHVQTFYFVRTATAGTWDVYGRMDNGALANTDLGGGAGLPVQLVFDQNGALDATASPMPLSVSNVLSTGAVTPLAYTVDFTGSTQYGSSEGVTSLSQDGYSSGRLTGFNVSPDGLIVGRYTNGQSRNLGQVVLADFVNSQGLGSLGNNLWQETVDSGLPLVGAPNSGTVGTLQSGALEESNVELTQELVAMIVAQRVYQANAQTIKTQDSVLQTIVNLR